MPKLLQRPRLEAGKWWDGYVVHVLAENGHAPTRDYMQGRLERFVDELVPIESKLKALAGNPIGERLRAFSDFALPAWAVRGPMSATAYCPCCFWADPVVQLSWRLRAVTHCREHRRLLETTCGACGARVFHWDLARGSCRCGAALGIDPNGAGADDRPSTHAEAEDLEIFSSQFTSSLLTSTGGGSVEHQRQTFALIVFLARALPTLAALQVKGADHRPSVKGLLEWLGLTAQPRVEWVETLWKALPSAAHLRTALNSVLALFHDERAAPSDLSALPLWSWAEDLCKLGASPAEAERRGWAAVGSLKRSLVPTKVAARQAGLSEMHLHHLMGKGLVAPARTFSVGDRQHLFSDEQVRALERFRHNGYGYGRSLNLGIEGNGLSVFRVSGVVSVVAGNAGRAWLDGVELRELLAELTSRATRIERLDGTKVSLGSKRLWQFRHVPALKPLFSRLRTGEFEVWASGDTPGFASLFIGTDSIEFLHRGIVGGSATNESLDGQQHLPLIGGAGAWIPTSPPWNRPPPAGRPRAVSGRSSQLLLEAI